MKKKKPTVGDPVSQIRQAAGSLTFDRNLSGRLHPGLIILTLPHSFFLLPTGYCYFAFALLLISWLQQNSTVETIIFVLLSLISHTLNEHICCF